MNDRSLECTAISRRRFSIWIAAVVLTAVLMPTAGGTAAEDDGLKAVPEPEVSSKEVRPPIGPDDLPETLPGRWKVSLCVMVQPGHAWIRFENVETGEVRSISRFHLFVGAWFDEENWKWHYAPTTRTGVYMDREQSIHTKYPKDRWLLLSAYVDNPKIYKGENTHGHGMARNNCVTYTRDAWYFYTGEYYALHRVHDPAELRRAVVQHHPEVVKNETAAQIAESGR